MSKLSRFWKEQPEWVCAIALFLVVMVHGATIGLTDDEAYYWVLAQKPALGYAYHPPMVAWLIALSQALLGGIFGAASTVVVRFPAAFCSAGVLFMALSWLRESGVAREKIGNVALALVSFAALFALSWMMVPDISLFLGWMIVFVSTWKICFEESDPTRNYVFLLLGSVLSLLSKYSAVLLLASSFVSVLIWAPRSRWVRSISALVAGGVLASVPIILWNMNHAWASILYQIHDRHEGGSFSLVRWARFWAIEIFAGGPALIFFSFVLLARVLKKEASRTENFLWVFAGPAALVFCFQPLWSDFKPHWALVVWWPLALGLARAWALEKSAWAKFQIRYGLALGAVVLIACHAPIGNKMIYAFAGSNPDPRLDVTNDLYGWRKLSEFLKAQPGNADLSIPVLGSRYQTASQAWFSLGAKARVSLIPLDIKSRDEWPDLSVSKSAGPEWSELTRPVFFVADNRYDAPPEFPHSHCSKVGRVQEDRGSYPAKWIDVWRCEPEAALTPIQSKSE